MTVTVTNYFKIQSYDWPDSFTHQRDILNFSEPTPASMVLLEIALFGALTSVYIAVQAYFCRHPEIPNGVQNIYHEDEGAAWEYAMYNKYTVW